MGRQSQCFNRIELRDRFITATRPLQLLLGIEVLFLMNLSDFDAIQREALADLVLANGGRLLSLSSLT